uniref:C6 domain-containing protein n=1 Tax=Heterorhabditis bacteriophora TaxID=37862 RepID=A0A1I7WXR6_HETBA
MYGEVKTMEQLVFTICFSIASLHQVILACMIRNFLNSYKINIYLAMCCKAPKFEDGSGRGVFLMTMGGKCPKMDTFLCRGPGDNTYNELGKYIVINGEINVKEDKQGGPIEIDITCNTADGTWRVDFQGESLVVKTVRCDNR